MSDRQEAFYWCQEAHHLVEQPCGHSGCSPERLCYGCGSAVPSSEKRANGRWYCDNCWDTPEEQLGKAVASLRQENSALQSELADLRKLAGELAGKEWEDSEFGICVFCREKTWHIGQNMEPQPENHAPDCLWLKSQRWKR